MSETRLYVYAVSVALGVLFLIPTGAVVTNSLLVPSPAAAAAATGLFSPSGHQHAAEVVGLLTVILVAWVWFAEKRTPVRRFALIPLVTVVTEIGIGHAAGKGSSVVDLVHAFLAPVLLATISALALLLSPMGRRAPVMFQDKGWPPMRGLAATTLFFVVLQVALGASFRHGAVGIMVHIVGALIVILLILTLVICLTQMAEHPLLRPAAITLLIIVFVQVFMGLTVISMSVESLARLPGIVFGVIHVTLGAVALSTSVVVAVETRRSVRGKA